MSDLVLDARNAGAFGRPGPAGVTLRDLPGVPAFALSARRGAGEALATGLQGATGLALPAACRCTSANGRTAIWTAPGQWLLLGAELTEPSLADGVGGAGSVTNLTGARTVVAVSGPDARAALRKLLPVDVDPAVFGAGSAAGTIAAYIGVLVWQAEEGTFHLACYRSFGEALWRALRAAAAEFGSETLRG